MFGLGLVDVGPRLLESRDSVWRWGAGGDNGGGRLRRLGRGSRDLSRLLKTGKGNILLHEQITYVSNSGGTHKCMQGLGNLSIYHC